MSTARHTLAAAGVAAALLAPAGAHAASIDGADAVRSLATEAVEVLTDEVDLVRAVGELRGDSSADADEQRAELREVDARGQSILVQLRGLGVATTPAIDTALSLLPPPERARADGVRVVPQPVVYAAAISDLERIATTPDAVAPVGDGNSGTSYALLLVAAVSLMILGGAAFTSTLWRRPRPDEELEALAWSDGLTGLANRRRLDHDLDADREGPTSVIMIDVDHFKGINDTFGHQAGDNILKRLGTLLAHHVRVDDVVYRYGGEEFCVLLPGADVDEAQLVADRIVEAARSIDLPNGAHVTVSVGLAASSGDELPDAVEIADRALYAAKQQGRDRAVRATPTDRADDVLADA